MKKINCLFFFLSTFYICNVKPNFLFNVWDRFNDELNSYWSRQYLKEKANPKIEEFVRSIAKELHITKDFDIGIMNNQTVYSLGGANAACAGNKLILLGPYFLDSLSETERRFLIGHELVHLKRNHFFKNLFFPFALFFSLIPIHSLSKNKLFKITSEIKGDIFSLLYWVISINGILLARQALSRYHEYEADRESALALKNIEGGILFFKNVKKIYSSHPSHSNENSKWLASHPSNEDRIKRLENLKV